MLKQELNALDATSAKYYEEFERVAKEHLREYVESITDAVPRFGPNAFVCPCCKSGTGNNNRFTPAFFLFRGKDGDLRFKCHACDITGTIFDLAGLVNNEPTFAGQKKIVGDFLGIDLVRMTPLSDIRIEDRAVAPQPDQKEAIRLKKEAAAYIAACRKNIDKTDYFERRGLSPDIIRRFGLGYDPKNKMAVIPFTSCYYTARNTTVGADAAAENKHRNPKGLPKPLYNMAALSSTKDSVVFVTEAPLDALSIIQAGGNAMALAGTATGIFNKILRVYRPDVRFVLAFDADNAGKRAQCAVATALRNAGFLHTIPTHPIFTKYKDANAALMADPQGLREAVAEERQRALSNKALEEVRIEAKENAEAEHGLGQKSAGMHEVELEAV